MSLAAELLTVNRVYFPVPMVTGLAYNLLWPRECGRSNSVLVLSEDVKRYHKHVSAHPVVLLPSAMSME